VTAQITTLPTPPSTNDPANFNTRADAFLGQMPTFVTEANALAGEVAANAQAAAGSATSAQNTADAVALKVAEAAASASSALNAPGTNGSSATSLTIGTGTKSFTTQTGKAWSIGQSVVIANTAAPTNRMIGVLTAYNSGTGAATVQVTTAEGTGTFTAWTIAMASGAPTAVASQAEAEAGTDNAKMMTPLRGAQQIAKLGLLRGGAPVTSITTLTASSAYSQTFKGEEFGSAFILPDATTLPTGPRFSFTNDSAVDLAIRDSAGVARRFLAPKETCIAILQENASAGGVWQWIGGCSLGVSARQQTGFVATGNMVGEGVFQVRLDASRDLIIYSYYVNSTTYYKAVVYDRSSNVFGVTLSINSFSTVNAVSGFIRAKLIGVDKVLMLYMSSATEATAYVLTTSGVGVSAGAPVVATVASAFSTSNSALFDIEAMGTTYVLSMVDNGVNLRACGITVAGTTPTFGASTIVATAGTSMGSPTSELFGIVKTTVGGVPTLFMTLNDNVTAMVRMVTFSGVTPTVTGTFSTTVVAGSKRRAVVMPSGSVAMFTYMDGHHWCIVYYWTGSAWASTPTNLTVAYGWTNGGPDMNQYVTAKVSGPYLLANFLSLPSAKISALQFTEGASGALTLVGSAVTFDTSAMSLSQQRVSWIVTHRDGGEVFYLGGANNMNLYLKIVAGSPSANKLFSAYHNPSMGFYAANSAPDLGFVARSSEAMVAGNRYVTAGFMAATYVQKLWTFKDGDLIVEASRGDMRNIPVSNVYKYHATLKDGADRSEIWGMSFNELGMLQLVRSELAS
jgi:hypothetical protein